MYKALKTFSGKISMRKDEERAITDKEVVADLTRAGYIEEINPQPKTAPKKANKKEG